VRTVGLAGLRLLRVDGLGRGYDLWLSPLLSGSPRSRASVLTARLPISSSLTSCSSKGAGSALRDEGRRVESGEGSCQVCISSQARAAVRGAARFRKYLILVAGCHGEELWLLNPVGRRVCNLSHAGDCLCAPVDRQLALGVCVLAGGGRSGNVAIVW